jgi:hypothetical protein
MAVEQPVDQMQIAGSATASAHGKPPRRGRVRAGRECRRLLMTSGFPTTFVRRSE